MNWRWYRDMLAQWQQNQRLRYAVLLGIVIVAMHGILKIADRRDELVKDWSKEQDLLIQLKEVAQQPAWPMRAETAQARLRSTILALPLVTSKGQAQADQHMWLSGIGRSARLQGVQVAVEDALDVPDQKGLIQVVARLEGQDLPWKFAPALRFVERGLPWRQVQRMELSAGLPGKMSMIVRSYYRNPSFEVPPLPSESTAVPVRVSDSVKAPGVTIPRSKPAPGVVVSPSSTRPAPPATSVPIRRDRELPHPETRGNAGGAISDGVVESVLDSTEKPDARTQREKRR